MRPLLVALTLLLLVPAAARARVSSRNAVFVLVATTTTRAVSVAPDGSRAFVAAGITVSVIDLNSRLGAGSILMKATPLALAVSPDGNTVYAARKGAIETVDVPAMIRTGERKLAGTPIALVVTATRAVEVQQGGKVAILDLTTGRLVRRINLEGAAGVALDHHGRAWVSATTPRKGKRKAASRIVRIDPTSGGFSGSVALGTDGGGGLERQRHDRRW